MRGCLGALGAPQQQDSRAALHLALFSSTFFQDGYATRPSVTLSICFTPIQLFVFFLFFFWGVTFIFYGGDKVLLYSQLGLRSICLFCRDGHRDSVVFKFYYLLYYYNPFANVAYMTFWITSAITTDLIQVGF